MDKYTKLKHLYRIKSVYHMSLLPFTVYKYVVINNKS